MPPELRKEMLRILGELYNAEGMGYPLSLGDPPQTVDAVLMLEGIGALSKESHRITLAGYEYYEQLKAPRRYWLKQNWFPVGVLLLSSLVTVISSLLVVHLN